jgi:hypothetical protein
MTASIDTTGLVKMSGGVRRAVSGQLQKDMVESLHESGPHIVSDMKGRAFTRIQHAAAGTIRLQRSSVGIEFDSGGGGFPGILFNGAEFGGRKSKKVAYANRSRVGKPYVVRRRTTMQFLPFVGHEGYFFWPAYRDWLPKLIKEQEEIVEKALGGS